MNAASAPPAAPPAPPPITTHRDLLTRWRTYADLARELTEGGISISGMGVVRWASANEGEGSIPGEYWHLISLLASRHGFMRFNTCLEMLAFSAFEAEQRRRARAERARVANDEGEGGGEGDDSDQSEAPV